MKHIKRCVALCLALTLTFCLALPAMAAVNWEDFDWEDIEITVEPQTLYVPRGESFTLSAQVNLPAGVERVTYQWHRGSGLGAYDGYAALIEGATSATLTLSPGDPDYPSFSNQASTYFRANGAYRLFQPYTCEVTAYDSDGNCKTIWNSAELEVEGSFWVKLYGVTLEPFVYAWETGLDMYGFGLVFFPIFLVQRYIDNFSSLI